MEDLAVLLRLSVMRNELAQMQVTCEAAGEYAAVDAIEKAEGHLVAAAGAIQSPAKVVRVWRSRWAK